MGSLKTTVRLSNGSSKFPNRHNIKIHVVDAARKVREFIRNQIDRKLISLKIDSASRHGRHIIGVNVQYEVDGEIANRKV